jgi:type III restriction enzyme
MTLDIALNTQKGHISKINIPEYITDNLAFPLREYQKDAITRFLYYYDNNIYDTDGNIAQKSRHLLWQMATGSGKTLIMAALILEMYKKGYRNFWFFVTSTDIITKTVDNFTNSAAKKYQFAQKIEIDGQQVEIRQVENFTNTNSETINIKFSTINILHQISQPEMASENSVTLDDFKETPLILIGDEAHHLNAATKKEKEEESTWENSVQLVLKANPENRLFEFTATANLTNAQIAAKYENKLLYNYELKYFRNDKFSKDIFTFTTDGKIEKILLRAVLISQYRKHIAAQHGIFLKPVILFKSKLVADSKTNFETFNRLILTLSAEMLKNELNAGTDKNDIWNKTIHLFSGKENELCEELKLDFSVATRKTLLHDGTNSRIPEQPKLLATLEDNDNPVRAIFAVDMLKEGWDVLNLFDIVRLYDTRDGTVSRQGKYTAGSGTVSEAQLIGRGARYFPFSLHNEDKYKRKFDDNENVLLRAIEQMHYHCKHNPKYISEIRQTLRESGLLDKDDIVEITLKMKQDFIDGKNKNFQKKNVYVNKVIEKSQLDTKTIDFIKSEIKEQNITLSPDYSKDESIEIQLESGFSQSQTVFGNILEMKETASTKTQYTLSQIAPKNIIRFALNCNKNFSFDKLNKAYPQLSSISEFITKLGEKRINLITNKTIQDLSASEKVFICNQLINTLDLRVKQEQKQLIVSKHFYPQNVEKSFEQEIIRRYSKKETVQTFDFDWYVYENGVLSTEEESFIKWFAENMMTQKQSGKTELEEKEWTDIFLARNEKALKLYSWFEQNLGEGFEPDFVLFMKKKEIEYVFYIEPKGEHLLEFDKWKEEFLLEIEDVVCTQQTKMTVSNNWRIVGLPFYNEQNTKQRFIKEFEEKTVKN